MILYSFHALIVLFLYLLRVLSSLLFFLPSGKYHCCEIDIAGQLFVHKSVFRHELDAGAIVNCVSRKTANACRTMTIVPKNVKISG